MRSSETTGLKREYSNQWIKNKASVSHDKKGKKKMVIFSMIRAEM